MVEKPIRVQRRRSKGWRMPENTVIVCRPGIWGNPFLVHPKQPAGRQWGPLGYFSVPTAADAAECFREMMAQPGPTADALRERLPDLRGKHLACWCALDEPCHADVLLELANSPPSSTLTDETTAKTSITERSE